MGRVGHRFVNTAEIHRAAAILKAAEGFSAMDIAGPVWGHFTRSPTSRLHDDVNFQLQQEDAEGLREVMVLYLNGRARQLGADI